MTKQGDKNKMKVQVKKQSVMEGTQLVKELYFLTLTNDKNQEITLNVGAKTYTGVQTLLGQKPDEKPKTDDKKK